MTQIKAENCIGQISFWTEEGFAIRLAEIAQNGGCSLKKIDAEFDTFKPINKSAAPAFTAPKSTQKKGCGCG